MNADQFASKIAKLIADFGVPVSVSAIDSTWKFSTTGFYSEKSTAPESGHAALELNTHRKLYVPSNKKVPEPGDIVAFGKIKTRVLTVRELMFKGKTVAYVLEVQ